MIESAVYNAETGLWYRQDKKWFDGVQADTYPEAFQKLYGHPVQVPPPQRSPRRKPEEA